MSRLGLRWPVALLPVREKTIRLGKGESRSWLDTANIKIELFKISRETAYTTIFLMLDPQLPRQVAIPRTVIKEKLSSIYKELEIKKTARATDLDRWYYYKETSKRGSDGVVQSCLAIVSAKYKKNKIG